MELYNVLLKQSESININSINTNDLQESITSLDQDGQKIIYALIKYNYTLNNENHTIPYRGKVLKDGRIKIDMNEFTDVLIKILYLFISKHKDKINIDNNKIKLESGMI